MRSRRSGRRRAILALGPVLAALSGCGGPDRRSAYEYTTVAEDIARDTEAARRLNTDAAGLIGRGHLVDAEDKLKEALTADITFGPAHNNLGKVYFHQRMYYHAAWEFQYAIRLMPRQPAPKNNLGLVFEAVGKLDDAVEQYDAALLLESDNVDIIGNLARARIRRGDRTPEVRDLLAQIVLKGRREDWVAWAGRNLTRIEAILEAEDNDPEPTPSLPADPDAGEPQ